MGARTLAFPRPERAKFGLISIERAQDSRFATRVWHAQLVPPTEPTRPGPKKTPRQERSRALFAAIIEAARLTIEETGIDFTLSDVATRAGVSPGSFYQYFPDRLALVGALVDDQIARDREALAGASKTFEAATLCDLPRLLAASTVALYARHPTLLLSMVRLMQEVGRHEDLKGVVEDFSKILGTNLRRCCPERGETDALRVSAWAVAATLGVVRQAAEETPGELLRPEFRARVETIARVALEIPPEPGE